MKKFLSCMLFVVSINSYASLSCPQALPTDHTSFCSSFADSAQCHCLNAGYPQMVCGDMDALYKLMIMRYFSIKNACKHQDDVPVQTCVDDWHCYRDGGKDSAGRLCSTTGKACR